MNENAFYETMIAMGRKNAEGGSWDREANNQAFEVMDANSDHVVNKFEFIVFYRDFLPTQSVKDFDGMISRMETHAKEILDKIIAKREESERRKSKFTAIFQAWDGDSGGTLDSEEMYLIGFAMHDGKWNRKKTKNLIKMMDKDGDGGVSLEEFLAFYDTVIYDMSSEQFERGLGMFNKVTEFAAMAAERQKALDAEKVQDDQARAKVKECEEALAACSEEDKAAAQAALDEAKASLEQDLKETAKAKKADDDADRALAAMTKAAEKLDAVEEILAHEDKEFALQEAKRRRAEQTEVGDLDQLSLSQLDAAIAGLEQELGVGAQLQPDGEQADM